MDSSSRQVVECAYVAMEAVRLWNETGLYFYHTHQGEKPKGGMELAAELERCLRAYQKLWRRMGKEAGLGRISEVFCWYAYGISKSSYGLRIYRADCMNL